MKPTHFLAAALITALILACLAAPAAAFSGAGSGTESDPYIITSVSEFLQIKDDLYAYYALGNDIDFTSSPNTYLGNVYFHLDGRGYALENLYITGANNMFSLNAGGSVSNLTIRDSTVYRTSSYSSAFFIESYSLLKNIIIDNCYTRGTGQGGTLFAYHEGSIENVIIINSKVSMNSGGTGWGGSTLTPNSYDGYQTTVKNSVTIGSSLTASSTSGISFGRIMGRDTYGVLENNYADAETLIMGVTRPSTNPNSKDGADITSEQWHSESWWKSTMSMWDWENVWQWNDDTNLPELRNATNQLIPTTISAISATPAIGGQLTEYTLSVTASTEAEGGIASYQWYYSTNSGNTWQAISGANTASYVWQPGQSISGDVLLKCLVTGADGGETDSYEAGYTNIKITVITSPAISSISVSRPLQKVNAPTTLTAIFADTQTATYQWYYSTNGGTTWQAISGATQTTAQYTPTTTGTHSIKIIATNQYGESSELSTTISVLPTYTPTPITQTTFDASIDSSAKYQGVQQFTLSAELKALNYYTPNLAHLAHDNALYYLDSAEQEVIPVSNTTGGTISAAYLGQYTGVITDTAGNTAFYSYQTNDWQYVEQSNAQIIASTSSYAATVSGGTLRIYNLNGNLVASTATTAANLAGNDATNVFVSYSGSTLTYYWVNGNSISTASQTLTHSITELHQITGTGNFIVSTAANTYILQITDAGVYSIITTSDTDTPLLNTQSTSINVFIGTSGNEIYIIGADGETDGTYVSGSTLMDASISKATGLYALAGGADYQVYILAKSQSSTWQLQQVVAFGSAIDYSQISTTGTYAAISTGLKLYLLEAVDVSTGTYMLQGAVIGSSGSPYAGKLITINGDQIRTDTSGRFLYPVSPGTLYTIIADTTEVEYTATNAALQQIAIKMKPNPYAQSVSYSAEYNEDTSSFEMQYEDQTGKTESVTWVIRESGNSTTVWTGTSTPGQTISWEVPFDKVFTGYQISMIADRSGSNVENVWMITPAGSQPIDIGGLDDTGKNIIFGCVLMVLAGLFGVMYSTKGALFIVLAAGVMVFLGLLTIPWEVIIVAGLLAVLALLAKGGGGS